MKIVCELVNDNAIDKIVLYTPKNEFINTPKSKKIEVIAIYEKNNYVIKKIIKKGNNKIPLNGIIISYPIDTTLDLKVGDIIEVENYKHETYVNALLNTEGKRCVIHKHDARYFGNEVALIDRKYSIFTLVYNDYYELIMKLDPKVRGYVISSLKHKKYNKMLGREIDKGSYVLLCNDTNQDFYNRFKEGEEVFFEIPLIKENTEISFKYTAYNPAPSKKVNFDATYFAFRAPDTCMIYDINGFSVDKKTRLTGTNVWGYEVAIDENGTVIEGNINVKIPENGYVISGVSDYYPILKNIFQVGGKVTIDKKKQMVHYKGNHMVSCLYLYDKMADFVKTVLERVEKLYDLNTKLINKYVDKFNALKEKMLQRKLMIEHSFDHEREYHLQRFDQYFNKACDYYHQLYKLNIEPSRVELRACWHAPREHSYEEVVQILDTLKASNFNEILIGCIEHDGVIYKSKMFPIASYVKGWYGEEYQDDYLACLVAEAKKRNIKVQVLVDNFFMAPLLLKQFNDKYLHLVAKDYYGNIGQHEHGEITLFLDPANNEAHDLLLGIYKEILDNYEIAGFQLDYIRYCIGNDSYLTAFGYNEESVSNFKNEYNYHGDIHELVKDGKIYEDFCEFRRNQLTSYVSKMRNLVNNYNNVQLTIAVVSEYEIARSSKLQDWPKWANLGLIDGVYLMAYHLGDVPVFNDCVSALQLVGDNAYVYGGIAPIYNGSNINLVLEQLNATKESKSDGFALFAFHSFQNRPDLYYYFNNDGPYSKPAIPNYETKENVIKSYCDEVIDRYDRLYSKNNCITKDEITHFIDQLKNINTPEDVEHIDYIAHPNVRIHLDEIKEKVKRYLSVHSKKHK